MPVVFSMRVALRGIPCRSIAVACSLRVLGRAKSSLARICRRSLQNFSAKNF